MKLKRGENEALNELLRGYFENEYVKSMSGFVQHGRISTLQHCASVARLCFLLNRRLRLHCDEKVLVTSAILHDFYLYDWHVKDESHKLHGFRHPARAAENAKRLMNVGEKELRCIRSHMWPLTITKIPTSREAWVLCIADKCCALKEMVNR